MAAITRIVIAHDSNDVAQGWAEKLTVESADVGGFCSRAAAAFDALAGGFSNGVVSFEQETGTTVTGATATITITHANVANNDTVTIGGRVITAKTAGATENEWTIGADATADAAAFVACINAHSELKGIISATNLAGVMTVTCLVPGLIGKHITLATSKGTAFAFSSTNLALATSPTVLTTARTYKRGLP